jgi:hypothetical protein
LSIDDIELMIKEVTPITNYALQQYKMPLEYKDEDLFKLRKAPHSAETFKKAKEICRNYAQNVLVRD